MKSPIKSSLYTVALSSLLLNACAPAVNETPEGEATEDMNSTRDAASSEASYADGTYTATGHYISPAGEESVEVTLTLASDVVTGVEIGVLAENPGSKMLQGLFSEGIGEKVIGKDIDSIELFSSVNGSSLTPKGFDEALQSIKAEASAAF